MTRDEEWADPEIQALLADVRLSIESYLGRKISRPTAPMSAVGSVVLGESVECFTAPVPEAAGQDKLYVKSLAQKAAV